MAIDVGAVEESTVTDGESGLQLTLELDVETARIIEECAEILVAEGIAAHRTKKSFKNNDSL